MTPAALLQQVAAAGVQLSLSPTGKIKAMGQEAAIAQWLPLIRDYKPGLVALLQERAKTARSWGWRLHFAKGRPVEAYFTPPATHAQALAAYPGAIGAAPIPETPAQPAAAPMTASEEATLLAWLEAIEETDSELIDEVLARCQADKGVRAFFIQQAKQALQSLPFHDDRRHCAQCTNLTLEGRCLAAQRGEITASRNYHPVDHLPRRCEGYSPKPGDPDRRLGRERWPARAQAEDDWSNAK